MKETPLPEKLLSQWYGHFHSRWTVYKDKERIHYQIFYSSFCDSTGLHLRVVVNTCSVAVWNKVWTAMSLVLPLQIRWTGWLHMLFQKQNILNSLTMKWKQHDREKHSGKSCDVPQKYNWYIFNFGLVAKSFIQLDTLLSGSSSGSRPLGV